MGPVNPWKAPVRVPIFRAMCDLDSLGPAPAELGVTLMRDDDVRALLQQHWAASDDNDFDAEHAIYADHAILEYPQSGERIRGAFNIQASRTAQPNRKRFTVRRVLGGGGLWISELILTYDAQPVFVVSIMEFEDGKVV